MVRDACSDAVPVLQVTRGNASWPGGCSLSVPSRSRGCRHLTTETRFEPALFLIRRARVFPRGPTRARCRCSTRKRWT